MERLFQSQNSSAEDFLSLISPLSIAFPLGTLEVFYVWLSVGLITFWIFW